MEKARIVVLGKLPPPYMGTAVWFDTLRHSSLTGLYDIQWFNVNVHSGFPTMGKGSFSKIWPNIRLYFQFKQLLLKFKPHLVLIPFSQTTIGFLKDSIFIRMAKRCAKTLVMLHGSNLETWLANAAPGVRIYFSSTMKDCCGAVVLGKKLQFLFHEWFPEDKIFVVQNGLKSEMPNIKKACSDRVILRFLSNLSSDKGIRDVISAMDFFSNSKGMLELKINGTWLEKDTEQWCLQKVRSGNLPVIYEGPKLGKEKAGALINSDIFIFTPNAPEGHPLVIIEAMAAGLPIITTDQGAITESVIDGVNGFIVKPNCPEEIAGKIRFLLDHPQERARMGKESRRLYEENFTEEKMMARLKLVFDTVLIRKQV